MKRRAFARRAVRRFMPGETLDDALEAGIEINRTGRGVVLTHLGENVAGAAEAGAVVDHYLRVLDQVAERGVDAEISVKPTQIGLDDGLELATGNLRRIVAKVESSTGMVWIDMEASPYVDATLDLVRAARARSSRVGVCLQAYLHRTPDDLASLMDLGVRVRLVKGAYREHPAEAIQSRAAVDSAFHDLATRIIADRTYVRSAVPVFGTHDDRLIAAIREEASRARLGADQLEFHLLYGVRTELQQALVADGARVRTLIAYGEHWFPWYMRRLAERPANVWFVARQLVSR